MTTRSPIELLGAVLDEVEGLRRTDARSHLPEALLRELRVAVAPPGGILGMYHPLHDITALSGQTITRVFEDIKRGHVLLLCSDGGFVALEAENDGSNEAYIVARSFGSSIADYLRPRQMQDLGLYTDTQRVEAERQERIQHAERMAKQARQQAEYAEATLAMIRGEVQ